MLRRQFDQKYHKYGIDTDNPADQHQNAAEGSAQDDNPVPLFLVSGSRKKAE